MDDVTRQTLQKAVAAAQDWFAVRGLLGDTGDMPELGPHRAAFDYMYVESSNPDYRARYGPIAPIIETQDGIYPMPLHHVTPEMTASWAEAFDSIEHPLLRSRYGDILWLIKFGESPHRYGRLAIDAYEALASGDDEYLTATHSMQRAIEIALTLNDQQRASSLAQAAVHRAELGLATWDDRPGVVLRLLEAAATLPKPARPAGLVSAIAATEEHYADDPSLGDAIADLYAAVAPDQTGVIRRRQLARWRAVIDKSRGIARQGHLEHALELAALHGLSDIRSDLRHLLQSLRGEPDDLHEISSEISVPRAELERAVQSVVGDDSLIDALRRLAAFPPSGDTAGNRRAAEETMQAHPIQFLVTKIILDADNLPIRYIRSRDEHLDAQIRQEETLRIRLQAAAVILPALKGILTEYGPPDPEKLANSIAGPFIEPAIAERIASGIVAYFDGWYDVAAHLLVPRIERVIREIGRSSGVLVIREPERSRAGRVRSLGPIMDDLGGVLPEDWRRYFANLLTDELGLNLRNRIAHGLLVEVDREDAALLVHGAVALTLFRPANAATSQA